MQRDSPKTDADLRPARRPQQHRDDEEANETSRAGSTISEYKLRDNPAPLPANHANASEERRPR